jgi:hypothetical protein
MTAPTQHSRAPCPDFCNFPLDEKGVQFRNMQKKKFIAFYIYSRPVYSIQEKKARISLSEKGKRHINSLKTYSCINNVHLEGIHT